MFAGLVPGQQTSQELKGRALNSLSQLLAKLDYEDVEIHQSKVPLTLAR